MSFNPLFRLPRIIKDVYNAKRIDLSLDYGRFRVAYSPWKYM